MKILFITAHLYLPQMYGGLQSTTHQLCHSLMQRGHKASVLTGLMPEGFFGLKSRIKMKINSKLSGCKVSKDTALGYPVWRTWFPWEVVEYVAGKEQPDLIVVLAMKPVRMALSAKKTGIPILLKLQDVEFQQHDGNFEELGNIPCVANSNFTAEKYRKAYGVNPSVIYPFISQDKYRTESSKQNVTFVNPVPEKGRDIALEIARLCPDIPFTFIEGWPLTAEQRQVLMQKLSTLSNVTLLASEKDMRKVYGKCKILLTPSIWEEAYGMVVTEAQISGIPVVASKRGGLPEAVGPGGITLDPDSPIDDWVKAIRKLWSEDQYYVELSIAARDYSQRPELIPANQIDAYEKIFMSVSGARST